MRIEDFPELIEVTDRLNGNHFTEHSKILLNTTYREVNLKDGYTLTIKNIDDYNELVNESNLFQLYPANDFYDLWPYYKAKLPIYIEGNFADVMFEDKDEFEKQYGIKLVTGVVERFLGPNFCNVGDVNFPFRLYVYEDYELGDFQNDY
jgi:hypothetical protein